MAVRRLSVLPFLLILFLYAGNLVAVIENQEDLAQNLLFKTLEEHGKTVQLEHMPAILSDEIDSNAVNDLFSNLASALPVAFDPPELDFGQQPLGMPYLHEVIVKNPTNSLSLQLVSIVGTAIEFHTSFFVSKVLRPGETTTFEVVFLARDTREVKDTLTIHSSLGSFEYKVSGQGVSNPFRLRALMGARIPINATYSPLITMYNPYDVPLQILEVYSSGKELKLELPTGSYEANKTVWEIRPYETKSIAKATFYGRGKVKNHTAFIRIKTNHETTPSLILPVEVEVCEATGLFASREVLDFGLIKSGAESKIPLYMLNAGPLPVDVMSITPTPENPSLRIELLNKTLKPATKYSKMANLILAADYVEASGYQTGTLKIWAEDRSSFHQLSVPYETMVMKGSLEYNHSQTLFRVTEPPFSPIIRNLTLQNNYHLPMVIYSAKLSSKAQELFTVEGFKSPYVLPPDGAWHRVLVLRFLAQTSDCLFNTTLRLSTNMSFYNIPLQCYDGRLSYDFGGPDVDALEFGLLSDHDIARRNIKIYNPNPVRVSISSMGVQEGSNIPGTSIRIVSMPFQDDVNVVGYYPDGLRKGRRPPYNLNPGTEIIFEVNVTRPRNPGKYSGELLIHTSFGKIVTVPVNYQAVQGGVSVVPSKLKFAPSFPYSTSVISLHVKSTYTRAISLESLTLKDPSNNSIQEDTTSFIKAWPIQLPDKLPTLKPSATTIIGDMVFNPLLLGNHAIYTCSDTEFMSNYYNQTGYLADVVEKMAACWNTWQSLVQKGLESFQLSLVLSTEIDSVSVPVLGELMWPKLSTVAAVKFPLTMIGNTSMSLFTLHNPSNQPVHVKPLFITDYPNHDSLLTTLGSMFSLDIPLYNHTSEAFTIVSNITDTTKDSFLSGNSSRPQQHTEFLTIPPHMNQTLHLSFAPSVDQWTHSLLLLINNLTSLEYVPLMGVGSQGYITVDGLHPNGTNSLLFEFTPTMMEECTRGLECGSSVPEPLVISKTLRIYNSGPMPLQLLHASINGDGCHGYGFNIANCEKKFILYPNKTRKIDVSFTPDYTLSRITSTLRLYVGDDFLDFPLLATLPHHMLTTCYMATPVSESEALASYLSVPLWVVALIVMIVATIFQVNWHIGRLHKAFHACSHGKDVPLQSTGSHVFDLNNITRQVSSTLTNNVVELEKRSTKSVEVVATPTTDNSRHAKPLPPQSSKSNESEEATMKSKLSSTKHSTSSISSSSLMATDNHTGIQVEPATSSKDTSVPTKDAPTKSTRQSGNADSSMTSQTAVTSLAETTPSEASYSPTKRRSKRVLQVIKSDKSPEPTPKSEAVPIQPESLVSGAVSAIKQTLLFRKESDESIPSVESDNSASEHSNDPPPSISPDPTDSVSGFGDIEATKVEVVTTYTKEPGTGQTVPVKDNEDLGGASRTKDEGGTTETTSVSTTVTSTSTSTGKQSRSKKKQKAQQRREEKMRRRQREREELAVAKRQHELQDSMDKESIASTSTVSTENYDDDTTHDHTHDPVFTAVENPKDESIKTKEESPEKNEEEDGIDTVIESVSIVIPAQEKEDITLSSSSEPSPTSSQSSCSEDLSETPRGSDLVEMDGLHESVKLAEEIGGTTQVQAPPSSPPPLPSTVPVEEERPQTKQSQTKPKKPKDNEQSQLPEKTPSKGSSVVSTSKRSPSSGSGKQSRKHEDSLPTTGKPRPSKLVMKEGNVHDDVGGERPVNPHALAASLLKEDVLKSDKKGDAKKVEMNTMTNTAPASNSSVPTAKGSTRKGDHASNKRGLSLDAQAQPFYPPYTPYRHPIMAQQRKSLLPGHTHRMPSPPYDYRHGYYPEEMHQGHTTEQQYYERRRRKRSEPSKSMTPSMPYPYTMEGGASYDRPHPYAYDPECVPYTSPGYVDGSEYLHHREYMGHHYPAHSSLRSAPPYDSTHPPYAGVHRHVYQEGGNGVDWEKLVARSPEEDATMRRLLALRQLAHQQRLELLELEREKQSLTLRELQNDSSSMLMALKEEDILSLRHLQQKDLQQRAGHTPLELTQRLPPSSTLNRAPGEHPTRTTPTNLSSLLSGGTSRWPPDCSPTDKLSSPDSSSKPDVSSTWQTLWSLDSPLSTALDEQRLIAAASLSAPSPPPLPSLPEENTSLNRNTYNLFEDTSNHSNIWGTEGFSWIPSDSRSDEKDA